MMHEAKTSRIYDLWAKFYDHTFHLMFRHRQRRAIQEMRLRPGQRVLDLGVGTGLTLDLYPADVKVVGVDLSRGMLKQAQAKVDEHGYNHVELLQADAMNLPFAEQSFDHVLISHVISVVSDPVKLLDVARRVVKRGGRIVIVNHFQSAHRPIAAMEKLLNPICTKLGWRSDMSLADVVRRSPLRVDYQFKLSPIDLWQIVVMSDGTAPLPPADQAGEEPMGEPIAHPS
jgi:phosphatidylethanolamine/phosphatidyl-N-methylethanolamine N-methyltransferase